MTRFSHDQAAISTRLRTPSLLWMRAMWVFTVLSESWYATSARAPAEADVNTLFLTDTGTSVGSAYTLFSGGHRVTVRIVGEVFRPGKDVEMFVTPATLAAADPGAGPQQYDVALRPGTSPQAYANAVSAALGPSYQVNLVIAVAGALGPAWWAAKTRTAFAIRAE